MLAACTGGESDFEHVDYEPLLGGPFVCLITQFVYRLMTNAPAGFIVWAATIATSGNIDQCGSRKIRRQGASAVPNVDWIHFHLSRSQCQRSTRVGAVLFAFWRLQDGSSPADTSVCILVSFNSDCNLYRACLLCGCDYLSVDSPSRTFRRSISCVIDTVVVGDGTKGSSDAETSGARSDSHCQRIRRCLSHGLWLAILKVAFDDYGLHVSAL